MSGVIWDSLPVTEKERDEIAFQNLNAEVGHIDIDFLNSIKTTAVSYIVLSSGENQPVPRTILHWQKGQSLAGVQEDDGAVASPLQLPRQDVCVARGQSRTGEGNGEGE